MTTQTDVRFATLTTKLEAETALLLTLNKSHWEDRRSCKNTHVRIATAHRSVARLASLPLEIRGLHALAAIAHQDAADAFGENRSNAAFLSNAANSETEAALSVQA